MTTYPYSSRLKFVEEEISALIERIRLNAVEQLQLMLDEAKKRREDVSVAADDYVIRRRWAA